MITIKEQDEDDNDFFNHYSDFNSNDIMAEFEDK